MSLGIHGSNPSASMPTPPKLSPTTSKTAIVPSTMNVLLSVILNKFHMVLKSESRTSIKPTFNVLGAKVREDLNDLAIDSSNSIELLCFSHLVKPSTKESFEYLVIESACRMIAHEWGISGKIKIRDQQFNLEGYFSGVTRNRLAHSVKNFFRTTKPCPASALERLSPEIKKNISNSLMHSSLLSYGFGETFVHADLKKILSDFQAGLPITIGTGWDKHAVDVTILMDPQTKKAYIAYCNRGEKSAGEALQDSNNKAVVREFNPSLLTESFLNKIMDPNQFKPELCEERMQWLEGKMFDELQAIPLGFISKSEQKVGNCSFANAKGGFHAELVLLHYIEAKKTNPNAIFEDSVREGTEIFKEWEIYNRLNALEEFIDLLTKAPSMITPEDHYKMLGEISAKLTKKDKFKLYLEGNYAKTTIPENVDRMHKLIEKYIKNSSLPIEEAIIPIISDATATRFLEDKKDGAFLITRDPLDFSKLYCFYKQRDQTKRAILQAASESEFKIISEAGAPIVKNLKDLSSALGVVYPIKSDKELSNLNTDYLDHLDGKWVTPLLDYQQGEAIGKKLKDGEFFVYKRMDFRGKLSGEIVLNLKINGQNKVHLFRDYPNYYYFIEFEPTQTKYKTIPDLIKEFSEVTKSKLVSKDQLDLHRKALKPTDFPDELVISEQERRKIEESLPAGKVFYSKVMDRHSLSGKDQKGNSFDFNVIQNEQGYSLKKYVSEVPKSLEGKNFASLEALVASLNLSLVSKKQIIDLYYLGVVS